MKGDRTRGCDRFRHAIAAHLAKSGLWKQPMPGLAAASAEGFSRGLELPHSNRAHPPAADTHEGANACLLIHSAVRVLISVQTCSGYSSLGLVTNSKLMDCTGMRENHILESNRDQYCTFLGTFCFAQDKALRLEDLTCKKTCIHSACVLVTYFPLTVPILLCCLRLEFEHEVDA